MKGYRRPTSIEESIIISYKQMNLMRDGLLPEQSWADARREIEAEIAAETAMEELIQSQ